MVKVNPAAFMRQVKQEISKVTWPTRQEAVRVTIAVVVLCLILSAFFFVVDVLSRFIVQHILSLGG